MTTPRCEGQFCHLVKLLCPNRDVAHPNTVTGKRDCADQDEERSRERERAVRIASRILSKSEMVRLEESGKLIQMRIIGRVDPFSVSSIKRESIQIAKNEHRLALATLTDAEEMNCEVDTSCNDLSFPGEAYPSTLPRGLWEKGRNEADNQEGPEKQHGLRRECHSPLKSCGQSCAAPLRSPGHGVQASVCDMCARVYAILDFARENLLQPERENRRGEEPGGLPVKDDRPAENSLTPVDALIPMRQQKATGNQNDSRKREVQSVRIIDDVYLDTGIDRSKSSPVLRTSDLPPNETEQGGHGLSCTRTLEEKRTMESPATCVKTNHEKSRRHGSILIADDDQGFTGRARAWLEPEGLIVAIVSNVADCIEFLRKDSFNALIVQKGFSASVIKWVRNREKTRTAASAPPLPVIVTEVGRSTRKVTRCEENGSVRLLDKHTSRTKVIGCIRHALGLTIEGSRVEKSTLQQKKCLTGCESKAKKIKQTSDSPADSHMNGIQHDRILKEMNSLTASPGPAIATRNFESTAEEVSDFVSGKIEYDSRTTFTYTVMGGCSVRQADHEACSSEGKMYNLVVCHDIFDTQERFRILLQPIIQQNKGMQILLWNYPGQAFTEFPSDQVLNNEFHAACLQRTLEHVGQKGTKQFDTERPFFLMGHGSGASIAVFYASTFKSRSLRGLLLVNGISFVDPHYASVLHDCRNTFSCSPEARPDLPVYFYSRFIFSSHYLGRVSAELALNLHTAVHNPISIRGRMQLCLGALKHVDLRQSLKDIGKPTILVYGEHSGLVRPLHAKPFIDASSGVSQRTIEQALKGGRYRTAVLMTGGGHDLFQEKKQYMSNLIQQLVTGYHEAKDETRSLGKEERDAPTNTRTLQLMVQEQVRSLKSSRAKQTVNLSSMKARSADIRNGQLEEGVGTNMEHPSDEAATRINSEQRLIIRTTKKSSLINGRLYPSATSSHAMHGRRLENKDNAKHKQSQKSKRQEFMTWRRKRDKTRLAKLQEAAKTVQSCYRKFAAKQALKHLIACASATFIQRCFRGKLGRLRFRDRMKTIEATEFTQRAIRGFIGRSKTLKKRKMAEAQVKIARLYRTSLARSRFSQVIKKINSAASSIQCMWRRIEGKRVSFTLRIRVFSATFLQRVYRGHLGRRKFARERKKYLFCRSQSSGIEIGRQMLTEHRLRATKLQSEVAILNQEKSKYDEQMDELMDENSRLEECVRKLEHEMHQLSVVEARTGDSLEGEAKQQLREQKARLDKEFSAMLAKISHSREELQQLQEKLGSLERQRQAKYNELKKIERKLVVLLEAQQTELSEIRRLQEEKEDTVLQRKVQQSEQSRPTHSMASRAAYDHGPSAREKQQAAQLMNSTESMMKFGFMSMGMTYVSSLNMLKAMKTVAVQDTVMSAVSEQSPDPNDRIYRTDERRGDWSPGNEKTNPSTTGRSPSTITKDRTARPDLANSDSWTVDDVQKWLASISLGQYREAFKDGAVDGSFLLNLTDEDLRNTLGVEHKLHRKKILLCIDRLKPLHEPKRLFQEPDPPTLTDYSQFETPQYAVKLVHEKPSKVSSGSENVSTPSRTYVEDRVHQKSPNAQLSSVGPKQSTPEEPKLELSDLFTLVRHKKLETLKKALKQIPSKRFDNNLVRVQYVKGYGTAYDDQYEKEELTMNKIDEHANTLLHIAAQNGDHKIATLLVQKGANPNHQNRSGNTPGHFAIEYQFYDLATWLFSPEGGGADDMIPNMHDFGPYDGLGGGDEIPGDDEANLLTD